MIKYLSIFILSLLISWQLHAADEGISENIVLIGKNIDQTIHNIPKLKHSSGQANHARHQMIQFNPLLKACVETNKAYIEEMVSNHSIEKLTSNKLLLPELKKEYQTNLVNHQKNMQYCEYLLDKIAYYDLKLQNIVYRNYQKQLLTREDNIFKVLFQSEMTWKFPDKQDLYLQIPQAISKHYQFLFFVFMVFLIYQTIKRNNPSNPLKSNTSWYHLPLIFAVFLLTDPMIYNNLAIAYGSQLELFTDLFNKNVMLIMYVVILWFYIKHLKFTKSRLDFSLLVLGLINLLCLYGLVTLAQDDVLNPSNYLYLKYICLISLPSLTAILIYFILYRLLASLGLVGIAERRWILLIKANIGVVAGIFIILFILGCCGYIHLAVSYWTALLIMLIFIFWFFMFRIVFDKLIQDINDPTFFIARVLAKHMVKSSHKPLPELVFLKVTALCGMGLIMFSIVWIRFCLPNNLLLSIYQWFYFKYSMLDSSVINIHILQASGVFLLLNLFNRFISKFLALQLVNDKEHVTKYQSIFFIFGAMISVLICLNISNINIKSLNFILGGVSIGAAIGLQELVSNFFSGIFLMIYHPFVKNSFISIKADKEQQAIGFVKNIGLMETEIETLDKILIAVPNLIFLKSMVKNYSPDKQHHVRLQFCFECLDIEKLDTSKLMILGVLSQEKEMILTGEFKPEILLIAKQETNKNQSLQLQVNFSIKEFLIIKQVVSRLTEQFTQTINTQKIPLVLLSGALKE